MVTIATSVLALPIRERIKDLVASTMGGITILNGYSQDIGAIIRDQRASTNVYYYPSISIIDRGDQSVRLVQGIYEAKMMLELRTLTEDGDRELRRQEIAILAADCAKAAMSQERPPLNVWGGLAVQTILQSADLHTSDASDPYGMMFLVVEILYRVQQANPYQLALI